MQTKNKIKYSSSLILSMIGSEAFKLGTAIYIYKFTNSFWLVSILYLLIQIPTFISYLLNYKITKKRNLKHILLWTDIISFSILATILIGYFVIIKSNNLFGFSIFLLVINSLLSIVHSFRFIALKTIIYNISNNEKDVKTYNVLTTISTSIAFLLAPIFSLILFSKLPFWALILLNMVTYLISGFLYFSFKLNEKEIELVKQEKTDLTNQSNIKQNNALKWVYTLSSSFIIGIFLYPKQSGMSQFFKVIDFDADKWSFFLTIIFALFGLLGSLLSLIIRNKNIKLLWVLIPMNLIFLITIPILFS
ncbi:methylase, partial [Metamycoplasma hyosynoviae]|nr:methylase [Metamycoplasma hyosynoviae]